MKKKRRKPGARVLEAMQIPPDLARRDCILTLCGGNEIYIENYRHILEYQEDEIRVLTKNGKVSVRGKRLAIISYTSDDMYITGQIQEIAIL